MSGGMDIDWDLRDKILAKAKEKFGTWTKEEIIKHSEWLCQQIEKVEAEEKRLSQVRRSFYDEQDEIYAILKEHK